MKSIIICLFGLLFLTGYSHTQWQQTTGTPEGGGITDMVVTSNGTIVVTCTSYNFPNGQFGGIRHSTNGGATWVNDYQHYVARTLAIGQNNWVWASSWNYPSYTEGLWVSYNQGTIWQGFTYLVGTNNNIFSILVRDNNQTVYIGTRTGVRKSTNGGSVFTPVNNGIPANSWVYDLIDDPAGTILAATSNGTFQSSNSGSSWIPIGGVPAGDTVTNLTIAYSSPEDNMQGEYFVVGGTESTQDPSLIQSFRENGEYTNWILVMIFSLETNSEVIAACKSFNNFYAGVRNRNGNGGGVYRSTNGGANFTEVSEGLPGNIQPSDITVGQSANDNLPYEEVFLGSFGNVLNGAKIYKRTFPIGIRQISTEVPENYSLSQNYPNPFNPVTKIIFDIPTVGTVPRTVRLIVYDILGREVETLVNQQLKPGTYEVDFDGSRLSSGVYFYKLVADNFTKTKKMLMIK